jgi:hypothetical protein
VLSEAVHVRHVQVSIHVFFFGFLPLEPLAPSASGSASILALTKLRRSTRLSRL